MIPEIAQVALNVVASSLSNTGERAAAGDGFMKQLQRAQDRRAGDASSPGPQDAVARAPERTPSPEKQNRPEAPAPREGAAKAGSGSKPAGAGKPDGAPPSNGEAEDRTKADAAAGGDDATASADADTADARTAGVTDASADAKTAQAAATAQDLPAAQVAVPVDPATLLAAAALPAGRPPQAAAAGQIAASAGAARGDGADRATALALGPAEAATPADKADARPDTAPAGRARRTANTEDLSSAAAPGGREAAAATDAKTGFAAALRQMTPAAMLPAEAGASAARPAAHDHAAAVGVAPLGATADLAALVARVDATQGSNTVAPASAPLTSPVGSPGFGSELTDRISTMVAGGIERAEIVVTPQDLGPVRIELTMNGDDARLVFTAAHPDTRQAIEQSSALLRSMLAEQGLTLGRMDVGQGNQPQADGGARQDSPRGQSTGERTASAPVAAGAAAARGTRGLLDLFA